MKRIILCYDGTLGEYGSINTNVLKFYSLLETNENQLTFYDPGVGTLNGLFGALLGWGIKSNIRDGYIFLMENYQVGDEIYIVGFSRGAYTSRALSGLIGEMGILKNDLYNLIPYIEDIYYSNKKSKLRNGFRNNFSLDQSQDSVHGLFLFDTVKTLFTFDRFEIENPLVTNIYQALAINEYRFFYKPVLFNRITNSVWFMGSHSDIGGGYLDTKISNGVLNWMIESAKKYGIKFHSVELDFDLFNQPHNSYTFPFNLIPKYFRLK